MKHENWKALFSAAAPYYRFNEAGRPYHNYSHALQVMDNVILLHKDQTTDQLLLAAIWHDAVYTPGSQNGLNEDASAAALDYEWKRLKIDEPAEVLNDTKALIEGTNVSNHMTDDNYVPHSELAILLDADLGSLALPYYFFVQNQENILVENSGSRLNERHMLRQKYFLSKFLTVRKNIYHTAFAREHWEPMARENIKLFIKG